MGRGTGVKINVRMDGYNDEQTDIKLNMQIDRQTDR